jgi:prefoldin subunit 5
VKDGNLAESAAKLKRRREQLQASLPALSRKRTDTLRLNSDALAVGRAGTTYQDPRKMTLLEEAEETADDAMRGVQRQIRQLDEEIGRASDGAFGTRVKRSARSPRVDR